MQLGSPRNLVFFGVTLVGLVLDQLTKAWIVANVRYQTGEIDVIPGFFSIVHARNPGAAFGTLGGFGNRQVVFGIFTVVALYVVFDMLRKLEPTARFVSFALGLILSGALGNALDRVRGLSFMPDSLATDGKVTDFLRVYSETPAIKSWLIDNFGTYEWPSFNVADIALVVGVAMLGLHWFFVERHKTSEATP